MFDVHGKLENQKAKGRTEHVFDLSQRFTDFPSYNRPNPQVFWRDDSNWYSGTVIDFSDGKHLIHYDDGDKERVFLKNEKVKTFCSCSSCVHEVWLGGSPALRRDGVSDIMPERLTRAFHTHATQFRNTPSPKMVHFQTKYRSVTRLAWNAPSFAAYSYFQPPAKSLFVCESFCLLGCL